MSKSIISAFRMYTPWGKEYYDVIFDFFVNSYSKYQKEYDHLYILSSQWNFTEEQKEKVKQIKGEIVWSDPSMRYFDAYKWFLPQVKESTVLLVDNDLVVYKPQMIADAFAFLDEGFSVVSIYDTIGKTFAEMGGKSKVCPYWFCTRKDLLMRYRDVDWGLNMPQYETMGMLTEAMIGDRVYMYEWPEDKNSIYYDGIKDGDKSEGTGTYHIRSGSVPAYLLATKKYGNKDTYWEYIKNQPKREYLRQSFWYNVMGGDPSEIVVDAGVSLEDFNDYVKKAKKYHGLSDN